MFGTAQNLVLLAVWVILLGVKGFAFIDCVRRPTQAFPAVGKQSKVLWMALTGVAFLTGLLPNMTLNLIGIAGAVAALVYLFDVRPRIIEILGR
jgi:hypothetical protein